MFEQNGWYYILRLLRLISFNNEFFLGEYLVTSLYLKELERDRIRKSQFKENEKSGYLRKLRVLGQL